MKEKNNFIVPLTEEWKIKMKRKFRHRSSLLIQKISQCEHAGAEFRDIKCVFVPGFKAYSSQHSYHNIQIIIKYFPANIKAIWLSIGKIKKTL